MALLDSLIGPKTTRILVDGVGWIQVKDARIVGPSREWMSFVDKSFQDQLTHIRLDKVIGVK